MTTLVDARGSYHYGTAESGCGKQVTPIKSGYWPCTYGDRSCNPKGDLSRNFHIYAIEWDSDSGMRWYLDGEPYYALPAIGAGSAPMPKDNFYLILQAGLVLNPAYHTHFNASQYPVDFVVDYVRVWENISAS